MPVGSHGDSYDRLWVLVERMKQSCNIIEQCMDKLPPGEFRAAKLPKKLSLEGEVYVRTENPLGLMGYYVVGDGKKEPYRLKMRTASFSNVSVIPAMLPGTLVPDLIAILGSIFFVVGDVDRSERLETALLGPVRDRPEVDPRGDVRGAGLGQHVGVHAM